MFSARFDKQVEDNEVLVKVELSYKLNMNQSLTESEVDNIDVKAELEQQIQNQEAKTSGWRFDKNNSITICF